MSSLVSFSLDFILSPLYACKSVESFMIVITFTALFTGKSQNTVNTMKLLAGIVSLMLKWLVEFQFRKENLILLYLLVLL